MEESEAGLICGEFDCGATVERDDYGVLDEAGGRFSVEVDQFQLVAMEVQWVCVVGAVAEGEAVALTLVEEEFVLVGVLFAVDGEGVELAGAAGLLLEDHVDVLGSRLGGSQVYCSGRWFPNWV